MNDYEANLIKKKTNNFHGVSAFAMFPVGIQ